MSEQLWTTSSLGGYLAAPFLSKDVLVAAQPLMRFQQFCATKQDFGKGVGDTMLFDKITNLQTAGGTLVETNTMPTTYIITSQGTLTLTEYGNGASVTGKLMALAEIDAKTPVIKALKNDAAKTIEAAVEAQMDACKIRYVASTASTSNIYTNGTAIQTASVGLTKFHLKSIVDYMMGTMYAPPADGEFYFGILTVQAARDLHDSLEAVWMYTQYPVNGELGKYYKARLVRDTYSMDGSIGVSSVTGEGYFFGDEAVAEGVAIPMEIRTETPTDFGRSNKFAWYAICGWKIMWSGDPDNRVVKWDSA
jgi:N4-gp56 family major capsid protein